MFHLQNPEACLSRGNSTWEIFIQVPTGFSSIQGKALQSLEVCCLQKKKMATLWTKLPIWMLCSGLSQEAPVGMFLEAASIALTLAIRSCSEHKIKTKTNSENVSEKLFWSCSYGGYFRFKSVLPFPTPHWDLYTVIRKNQNRCILFLHNWDLYTTWGSAPLSSHGLLGSNTTIVPLWLPRKSHL